MSAPPQSSGALLLVSTSPEEHVIGAAAAVLAMGLCESCHQGTQIGLGKPLWQTPLQNALAGSPGSSHYNYRARAALSSARNKPRQGGAPTRLSMPVKIKRRVKLNTAPPHPLLAAAIGWGR